MLNVLKNARSLAIAGVAATALIAGAASPQVASADHCQPEQLVGLQPVIAHDDSPFCTVMDDVVYPANRRTNDICLFVHPLLRTCDLYVRDVVELPEGKPEPH